MSETYVMFFWSILAIGFLALAFLSHYFSKTPLRQLKFIAERGGVIYTDPETGENLKYFVPVHSLFNIMSWVNFIAFLLAGLSALLSGGLL